jgi:hypothetical protein
MRGSEESIRCNVGIREALFFVFGYLCVQAASTSNHIEVVRILQVSDALTSFLIKGLVPIRTKTQNIAD